MAPADLKPLLTSHDVLVCAAGTMLEVYMTQEHKRLKAEAMRIQNEFEAEKQNLKQ